MRAKINLDWHDGSLLDVIGDVGLISDGDWVESKDQDPDGDVRLVQLADVGVGEYIDKSSRFLTSAKAMTLRCTFLCPGDLLVARMPDPIGRACIFPGDERQCVTVVDVCIVRPDPKVIDSRWLMYVINSNSFQREIERFVKGTTRQRISRTNLEGIPLRIPSLSEQRRIAGILDQAEALRAKRRAALAKLDTLAQSIFIEMFGDPVVNPKQWPVLTMASLFLVPPIFGTMIPPAIDGGEWLSMRVANIQEWLLDLSDRKYVQLPTNMLKRHSVADGDLLMARAIASQDHLGKCVVAYPRSEKWAFDSHLMRLRFKTSKTEPEFIRNLLMTPGGRQIFLKASRRSAVQFNINTKEIAGLRIPLPPITLQREFVARINTLGKLRTSHLASLTYLENLFASLQHRAFRGEL